MSPRTSGTWRTPTASRSVGRCDSSCFPSLSPFLFAALRYGLANGWKGLVLAEVFAATSGAGWAIADTSDYGNFEAMVGYTLYFALFSILVEQLVFQRLAKRVFRWRPSEARMQAAGEEPLSIPEP